jgi:hypothetical protein
MRESPINYMELLRGAARYFLLRDARLAHLHAEGVEQAAAFFELPSRVDRKSIQNPARRAQAG